MLHRLNVLIVSSVHTAVYVQWWEIQQDILRAEKKQAALKHQDLTLLMLADVSPSEREEQGVMSLN